MTTGVGPLLGHDTKGKYATAKASFVASSGKVVIGGMTHQERYNMKRNFLTVVLSEFILYAIQFLIIPMFYNNVIGRGNEGIAVLCFTTVLITATGMLAFLDKMSFWLLGILIYALLIFIYTPKGAYGIGILGMDLDGLQSHYDASSRYLGIAVVVAIVAFLQFAVWLLIKLFKITKH